jgi:hypothetical protein
MVDWVNARGRGTRRDDDDGVGVGVARAESLPSSSGECDAFKRRRGARDSIRFDARHRFDERFFSRAASARAKTSVVDAFGFSFRVSVISA